MVPCFIHKHILHWRFSTADKLMVDAEAWKGVFAGVLLYLANTEHCILKYDITWILWVASSEISMVLSEKKISEYNTYINIKFSNSKTPCCIGIILNTSRYRVQCFKLVIFFSVFYLSRYKERQQIDSNETTIFLEPNSSVSKSLSWVWKEKEVFEAGSWFSISFSAAKNAHCNSLCKSNVICLEGF